MSPGAPGAVETASRAGTAAPDCPGSAGETILVGMSPPLDVPSLAAFPGRWRHAGRRSRSGRKGASGGRHRHDGLDPSKSLIPQGKSVSGWRESHRAVHMKGRYYSPVWHRFVSSDHGADPNQMNQMAYCGGAPHMRTDPSGMQWNPNVNSIDSPPVIHEHLSGKTIS